jgi:hypothetical protein
VGYWALVLSADDYATERLFAHASVGVDDRANVDDRVVFVGDGQVFALGRVYERGEVRYTHRLLDEPVPFPEARPPGLHPLTAESFDRVAASIGAEHRVDADKRTWLVSVDLPIEAVSPAEAVREFWTYVLQLGPGELPAYVWPTGEELAMQTYVLGDVANQDPEED